MKELFNEVLLEIRSALRFRWFGMALAWTLCLAGWIAVAWMPDIYEGSARVFVDTSSVLQPILRDQIVAPDVATQVAYVKESLVGTARLDAVIRETGLDANVRDSRERDLLLLQLRDRIQIETQASAQGSSDSIYTISYRNQDYDKAVGVVRSLLAAFAEDTIRVNRSGGDAAGRFLVDRVADYERRLQTAEQALADFKRRHADRLPGAEGDYFSRIQSERDALDVANRNFRVLEAKRIQINEQILGEVPVADTDPSVLRPEPPPNSIDARIRDYQAKLDTMLLQYTDRHPDVIAVRETLVRLKAQRAEQLRALGISGNDQELSRLGSNPVHQALRISLNTTEVELATLKTDIAERTKKIRELQSLIDEVPEVEAQLARLNRDYKVVYDQYVELVKSRETQDLTQKASATDQVSFRIIDPPTAPAKPIAPPRLLFHAAVLVVALAAGSGLCYLLAQLFPVFGSATTLREKIGFPVLGTVAPAWQDQYRRGRSRARLAFAGSLGAMLAIFFAIVVIEAVGPGIHRIIWGA